MSSRSSPPSQPTEPSESDSSPETTSPSLQESSTPGWDALRNTAFAAVLLAGGVVLFLVMLYEMHTPPQEEVFLTPHWSDWPQ